MGLGSLRGYGLSCPHMAMGLFLPTVLWEEVSLGSPYGSVVWESAKDSPQN